jgi:hypothetical protein
MPPLQREVRRSYAELQAVTCDKIVEAVQLITDGRRRYFGDTSPPVSRSGDEHGAEASFALSGMVEGGIRLSKRKCLDHWLDPVLR